MTVTLQNLRAVGVGVEPTSLLPGQIAFNVTDKVIYVGDGSSLRTSFLGTTSPGTPGGGWFAMPMDFDFLNTYFLANPELYGDIPTDGQVVTWSTPLSRPIWTSNGGGGGSNQVYQTTNAAVASAPGATLSDKISAAIGVASPDEGNVTLVTGFPGDIYQGLYFFITSWVRGAYYAYPTASNVTYSNILSGLSAITVQQAIDEVDGLVNIAQSTANTAVADAAAAQALANAALPKAGGTMTGAISFVAGQTFPVSGIQDSTALQKGVVQGGSNMTYTSPGVMDVRAASVSQSGVVTLSDSTNLTSSTVAATSTAAKNLQDQIDAISLASNVTLAGTLDAASGLVTSVTTQGTAAGFVSGLPLPAAALGNADYYVIVDNDGSYNPPGGGGPYAAEVGDWFLSDGTTWQFLGVGNRPAYATTSSAGIIQLSDNSSTQAGLNALLAVTPASLQSKVSDSISLNSSTFVASSAAVKTAYDRGVTAETNSIPKTTVSAKGTIVTGTAANTPAALPVGSNGQILSVNSACSTGLEWRSDSPGDVTSVSGTAPITVNNFNPETPIVGISQATSVSQGSVQVGSNIDVAVGVISVKSSTTGQAGVVQLEDTTSSTSTVLALTANQGYSLQQQINALAVSNNITLAGTIDGSTGFMVTVTTEGAAKGFTIGAALPAPVPGNSEYFAIVTVPGTMTPPGGAAQAVNDGDWWLSNGTVWQYLPVGYSGVYATTTVPGVVQLSTDAQTQAGTDTTVAVVPSSLQSKMSDSTSTTSSTTIASSTAVKAAYDLANAAVPTGCYTALGALVAGTGVGTIGTLALGTNGQSLVVDTACPAGLKWGQSLAGYTCSATPFNTAVGALAGDSITTGVNNTVFGYNSGTAITGGLNNTFIGFSAGDGITTSDNSVAVGSNALGNTGGNNNTAVGYCTGGCLTSGGSNTFIGGIAGYRATTLDNAVAVGYGAMGGVTTGTGQVAVGSNALAALTSGAGNVAVGYQALDLVTTGGNNTAVGHQAGTNVATNVNGNTLIGFQAGTGVTTGGQNTFVGNGAGSSVTTGANNTILGNYNGIAALSGSVVLANGAGNIRFQSNSSGAWSYDGTDFGTSGQVLASQGSGTTPVWCTLSLACVPCSAFTAAGQLLAGTGSSTFSALTVGTNGQFLSANSACSAGLEWCTLSLACIPCSAFTGSGQLLAGTGTSTFIALPTGTNGQILTPNSSCSTGLEWITVGALCLQGYTCSATPFNTALGGNAGDSITSGTRNTAIGQNAGTAITTGGSNTVIGNETGTAITTGSNNTLVGVSAGTTVSTGNSVTAIGWEAGGFLTGSEWVAIGNRALKGAPGSTGSQNVAVGSNAGLSITTGTANTLIGQSAGDTLTTATNNVVVGAGALGAAGVASSQNVAIGAGAMGTGTASNGNTVAIGYNALAAVTSGACNTAVGFNAGTAVTTGSNNTMLGYAAGDTVTTGTQNTFLGSASGGLAATTSEGNTGVGFSALGGGALSGACNVGVGTNAGLSLTSGATNTFVGFSAGSSVTSGSGNTLVGRYAGTATLANNVVLSDGTGVIKLQINENGAVGVSNPPQYGTAGQTLQSSGTGGAPTWVTGATGSFTSQDGKTITVTNGIITSIV